ncbi:MAG: TIR domain-containing protein [Pseudomonadota bacterium]
MADIFISYARADRDKIEKLASALETQGYSVWWDRHIVGGAEFSKDIETALNAAKAVVVAWSAEANESRWVKDEAGIAANSGKLVALSLDGSEPPIGFKQFHAIDFSSPSNEAQSDLLRSLAIKFEQPAPVEASPDIVSRVGSNDAPRQSGRALLIATGLAVAALSILYFAANNIFTGPQEKIDSDVAQNAQTPSDTVAAPTGDYSSIAVLAFSDLSPDQDQEYFSDGISEELLNVLARETDLRVAARTSSFAFKGKNENVSAIGDALNVDAVLEGSVRKAGDQLRITTQLIDTRTGFHLWSDTFDREFSDVFAIQDEIARSIVASLPSSGKASAVDSITQTNSDAYDLFLRGRHHLLLRTRSSIEQARMLFERAVELDPDYAPAWAELAMSIMLLQKGVSTYGDFSVAEVVANAAPVIEKALALNPGLAEAHVAKGLLYASKGDWRRAIPHYKKGIELNPSTANGRHLLYLALVTDGEFREAFEVIDRAAEFDPLSALILENQVASFVLRDQPEAALATARRLNELHPGWPLAKVALSRAYGVGGAFAEAARSFEEAAISSRSDNTYGSAAFALLNIRVFDHPLVRDGPADPVSFLAVNEGRHDVARELVMNQFNAAPEDVGAVWRAGWTLWAIGDDQEAYDLFERYLLNPDVVGSHPAVSPSRCYPGLYIAGLRQRLGNAAAAKPILDQCRETLDNMTAQGYVPEFYERDMPVELMILEGRHEEALTELRRLADSGRFVSWWIGVEPIYQPLYDDPRFQAIVADLRDFAEREKARYLAMEDAPQ